MAATTAGAAGLLMALNQLFSNRELGKRRPTSLKNSGRNADKLYRGYEKRVNDIGSGRKPQQIDLIETIPDESYNPLTATNNDNFASSAIAKDNHNPAIWINPNADEAYLAHELGHIASSQTDIGNLVRQARDYVASNPKLGTALGGAMMIAPGVAAALEQGDDDLDTSIALAAATSLPSLIDEGLATKNGLIIMNNAGRRASMGQVGKLAGGYLSYLLPAIVAGSAGNFVGNQLDSDG